jgi:hypothetical protein
LGPPLWPGATRSVRLSNGAGRPASPSALALVFLWPRTRAPISLGRLALEALGTVLLLIGIASLAWALGWWADQRW